MITPDRVPTNTLLSGAGGEAKLINPVFPVFGSEITRS